MPHLPECRLSYPSIRGQYKVREKKIKATNKSIIKFLQKTLAQSQTIPIGWLGSRPGHWQALHTPSSYHLFQAFRPPSCLFIAIIWACLNITQKRSSCQLWSRLWLSASHPTYWYQLEEKEWPISKHTTDSENGACLAVEFLGVGIKLYYNLL